MTGIDVFHFSGMRGLSRRGVNGSSMALFGAARWGNRILRNSLVRRRWVRSARVGSFGAAGFVRGRWVRSARFLLVPTLRVGMRAWPLRGREGRRRASLTAFRCRASEREAPQTLRERPRPPLGSFGAIGFVRRDRLRSARSASFGAIGFVRRDRVRRVARTACLSGRRSARGAGEARPEGPVVAHPPASCRSATRTGKLSGPPVGARSTRITQTTNGFVWRAWVL